MTTVPSVRSAARLSVPLRVGVVLAVLQAVANLVVVLSDFGTEMPALAINVLEVVFAAAVLLLCVPAWRGVRWAAVVLAVLTVLFSLSGLFAFFVPGVPAGMVIAAAAGILLAVVTAVLLLARRRS